MDSIGLRPDILLRDYSRVFHLALGSNGEFFAHFTLLVLFLGRRWVVLNGYISTVSELR